MTDHAASERPALPPRPGAPAWLDAAVDVASDLDQHPWAPANLAGRAAERFRDRRRKVAATDAEWAAIQDRRTTDRGALVMLSKELDLTWGHRERQADIARRLTPDPWWLPAAHALQRVRVTPAVARFRDTVARARRGWAAIDAYNLSDHLPRHVGEQLAWLAEHAHGWPATEEFPTYEDWVGELRRHATVLTTAGYGTPDRSEELLDDWSTARRDADAAHIDGTDDAEALRATEKDAWDRMRTQEEAAHDAVTASMQWVAAHLHQLWD